ncbi:nucleotidyltransferase domain-containing protein [Fonticella tunisiensis]|uniref:Polymerase beta nucleotidyltransferase domain-containing protein n=1 Tax=Fonticella tunisiensis TaxID=1096341 RepID=A0A4R7KV27_9CLOT|nr:nucleotidyltransferase domain-containing protein [Fonticella tunisiensis]TDT63341.1 hypothetical protein EDD71_102101 [Fonticella tunisiensis]
MNQFGISEELLNSIICILKKNKFVNLAYIFGSRARGDFRANSDIDICIFGELSHIELNLITDKFLELNTPLDFDVVNFEKIKKEEFKKSILRDGVKIYERKNI